MERSCIKILYWEWSEIKALTRILKNRINGGNANFIRREKGLCQGALVITVHLIGIVDIVVPIPMNVKMKRGFMTNGIGMNISRKRIFQGVYRMMVGRENCDGKF